MKPEYSILALWAIALAATLYFTAETGAAIYLAPLFAVCMIGSVLIVRKAKE